jgi:DNA-binding NarL/FixJ family response regulator
MENGSHIRVALADELVLFREAVRVVLEAKRDIEVVAEARDAIQVVAEVARTRPDVAIVDANLPNGDGIRAISLIHEQVPECRVVVMTGQEDQRILLAALEAGANGYLTKESPLLDLIAVTRGVHRGDTVVPPRMLGPLLGRLLRRRKDQEEAIHRVSLLTRREKEILALLTDGAHNDRIAQTLVISPQTARTHIQNVLTKLGVHSRLEAAAFVRQNHMLELLSYDARSA